MCAPHGQGIMKKMEGLAIMYSIPPQMENELIRMGVLPPTELEALEELVDPRTECMQKDYFRSPYNEEGEIAF